jgi:hypothetical protein
MGYNLRPGIVRENEQTLTAIKIAIETNSKAEFSAPKPELYSLQYTLRRILKATEVYENECEGKFAGLGALVSLNVDLEAGAVIATARAGAKNVPEPTTPGELQALQQLERTNGSLTVIEFTPSPDYDEEDFSSKCHTRGWLLLPGTIQELETGAIRYTLEAIDSTDSPERGGFSALDP